jgi:hypothetical protein
LALVFAGTVVACGSRASEPPQVAPQDRLAALEKDPTVAWSAALHPTYKATYEINLGSVYPGTPPSPGSTIGWSVTEKLTVAARPPDFSWEIDMHDPATQSVAPTHAIAVLRGNSGVMCIETPAPACYAVSPDDLKDARDALNGSPLDQYRSALKDYDVTVLPRESIVRTETACFRWKTKAAPTPTPAFASLADVSLEGCFTADGVPLRFAANSVILSYEQKAVAFTTAVTDADFAAPYPMSSAPFPFGTTSPATPRPSDRPTPTR